MNNLATSIRTAAFKFLRAVFRLAPISENTRDKWRSSFLSRFSTLIPSQRSTLLVEPGVISSRPFFRSDESAIGYVHYREDSLPSPAPATLVAFYLPQFHTIPENDEWWGKGFTEWRNSSRALPQFYGHIQPRIPSDLGFYNLNSADVMRAQAKLAKEYGIGAFCFYFYWFAGKTLLENPLHNWLNEKEISFPYCLCWANENWARRWDGRNDEILIKQDHHADDDIAFITHVSRYLRDPRYLRVEGKPLLLVYRPSLMPDIKATAKRWRAWCLANDVGDIHLAYVQGFERPSPSDIGFDAAVEFPPNMSTPPSVTESQLLINPDFSGDVVDWRFLAKEKAACPLPDYTLYPGVNPGWDNEPRRSGRGRVYLHASPRGYQEWLNKTIYNRLSSAPFEQRITFINAWNEWAEGAVLEPDARLGYAWLEATRRALKPKMEYNPLPYVVIHVWYVDVFEELLKQLHTASFDHRLIITTSPDHRVAVDKILQHRNLHAEVVIYENHGRDILPFLHIADRLLNTGVSLVLKLHTKRSIHRNDGDQWRREMVSSLLAQNRAAPIINAFEHKAELGLVAPEGHIQPLDHYWGANEQLVRALTIRMGLTPPDVEKTKFASGSMFWIRLESIRSILDCHLRPSDFEKEAGQVDGTLAHAIERIFSLSVQDAGYTQCSAASVVGEQEQVSTDYKYAKRS
ncbi:hypothetical protein ASF73_04160 [Xanthomonas sp. Leaf131]|nr:hypothetical protein ASF73_04160 [Xanthomonas sp. Leaf131]